MMSTARLLLTGISLAVAAPMGAQPNRRTITEAQSFSLSSLWAPRT